jgi:lycopene beta-cyclase
LSKTYDYIIAGGGQSGLMVTYRMSQDPFFAEKQILIIEKTPEKGNDRTWCWWERANGEWDSCIVKSWDTIRVGGQSVHKNIHLGDYRYKMLRGADFYGFMKNALQGKENITFFTGAVLSVKEDVDQVTVTTTEETFNGKMLFSSIFNPELPAGNPEYPYLKQHFIGWFVRTTDPVFDPGVATFMDFSIPQNGNTRFMYVLPVSETEALLEYTLFSKDLLEKEVYEDGIKAYLQEKGISRYEITETETGSIPMTSYPFHKHNTKRIMYIGSAGGWTKPSTGYTFRRTMEISTRLIAFLKRETSLKRFYRVDRFWLYDLILLDVLYKRNEKGAQIFETMFIRNRVSEIFAFLDEKSNIFTELKIILNTDPRKYFIEAVSKRWSKVFTILFS